MRPLGDALAAAGFPAHAVRLPGHATSVADLAAARREQWTDAVTDAVARMSARASSVALVGMSLGALLSLAVAEAGIAPVHALALLGTPLRFADERTAMLRYVAWVPGAIHRGRVVRKRRGRDILDDDARARSCAYDTIPLTAVVELLRLRASVKRLLGRVTQPTLVLHGRHDRTAPPVNVELLRRGLRSAPVETAVFERSAHIITEDAERDAVAACIVEFVRRIAPPSA